jgi:hypothetical protein
MWDEPAELNKEFLYVSQYHLSSINHRLRGKYQYQYALYVSQILLSSFIIRYLSVAL